jgi:hypothetical protein
VLSALDGQRRHHGNPWKLAVAVWATTSEKRVADLPLADGRRLCEARGGGQFRLLAAAPAASAAADSGGLRG